MKRPSRVYPRNVKFSIRTSILFHILRDIPLLKENCMIISLDEEKLFDKIQYSIMIKTLSEQMITSPI